MTTRARVWPTRLGRASIATGLVLGLLWWTPGAAPTDRVTAHRAPAAIAAAGWARPPAAPTGRAIGLPSSGHPAASAPKVFVVGDSLTVGTEPWLSAALNHLGGSLAAVDARVGRGVPEGLAVLRARAGDLPDTVVVALGTNDLGAGPATVGYWLRAARAIVGQRRLVWVNLCLDDRVAPRLAAFRDFNAALAALASGYGVEVADWCAFATGHGILPGGDGIHYQPAAYAQRAAFYAADLAGGDSRS